MVLNCFFDLISVCFDVCIFLIIKSGVSVKPRCIPLEFDPRIVNVEENKPVGYTVFTYTGFDGDGDPIHLFNLDTTSPFSITRAGNWNIDVAESLDFGEENTIYSGQNIVCYILSKKNPIYICAFMRHALLYAKSLFKKTSL